MYKLDLHTHSQASPDGALKAADYARMLAANELDCIAITDHNQIAFAQELQKTHGERIIVGEEITTTAGEIIGLYLKELVPAGLSAMETVRAIKGQDGIVYIPHPFETVRHGLTTDTLDEISEYVDIVETRNGRAVFQNKTSEAEEWAGRHQKAAAASSDAHGRSGWGRTYTAVAEMPSRESLRRLLDGPEAKGVYGRMGLLGLAYPKLNRLHKRSWRNV